MTIQSALLCQPGTFHGGEGIKTTQQPPYVPNFGEVKSELADILLCLGGLMTRLERPFEPSAKKSLLMMFSDRWTAAKSTFKSALTRPNTLKLFRSAHWTSIASHTLFGRQ
jgi:hypothetical protein